MTAAQWAERLREYAKKDDPDYGNSVPDYGEMDANEARELASLLEAAEEMARALEELERESPVRTTVLLDRNGYRDGVRLDHSSAEQRAWLSAHCALAAWRGRK